jgi:adenosylhomocysteine nucleosidase
VGARAVSQRSAEKGGVISEDASKRRVTCIGVVAGLEPEIRALRKIPDHFTIAVSGMGAERAYRAGKRLIAGGASALVSWGSAAALDVKLAPGTLLVPRAIVDSAGNAHFVHAEWQSTLVLLLCPRNAIHTGPLAEASQMLASAHDKRTLGRRSGAAAADMESAGVARAAREHGVPFIAVRAVADGAEIAVPPRLASAVAADGSIDLATSVVRLAVSPWHWPAAMRLALGFRAALLTLRVAAPALYASAAAAQPAAGTDAPGLHAIDGSPEPDEACVIRE